MASGGNTLTNSEPLMPDRGHSTLNLRKKDNGRQREATDSSSSSHPLRTRVTQHSLQKNSHKWRQRLTTGGNRSSITEPAIPDPDHWTLASTKNKMSGGNGSQRAATHESPQRHRLRTRDCLFAALVLHFRTHS